MYSIITLDPTKTHEDLLSLQTTFLPKHFILSPRYLSVYQVPYPTRVHPTIDFDSPILEPYTNPILYYIPGIKFHLFYFCSAWTFTFVLVYPHDRYLLCRPSGLVGNLHTHLLLIVVVRKS